MSQLKNDPNPDHSPTHSLNENSIENRKYRKDSFDRFGDDLCEDIFSYFPIKVIIKYECVSQQWRRTLYQRVNHFVINSKTELMEKLFSSIRLLNIQIEGIPNLEKLLGKCAHITKFHIQAQPYFNSHPELNTIIAAIITKYCPNLKSINNSSVGLNHNSAQTFISSIGHKLETICLYNSLENFYDVNDVKYSKLRRLNIFIPKYSQPINAKMRVFNQIFTHLTFNWAAISMQNLKQIIRTLYLLTHLDITCYSTDSNKTEEFLAEVSNLRELKSLRIRFESYLESDTVLDKFKMIGQKCHKLETFILDEGLYESPFSLTVIENYPNLVTLIIITSERNELFIDDPLISCQSLHNCPNIQHLELFFPELENTFFEDIHKYVPKLRHLSIHNICVNEVFINYIEKLPKLQTVIIENMSFYWDIEKQFNPAIFYKLFTKCTRLKSVYLRPESESSEEFINWYTLYRNYFDGIAQFSSSQTWFILDPLI